MAIVTNPKNIKAEVYRRLGYQVLDGNLHEISGEAESEFDEVLGIGFRAPCYPEKGRGFHYSADAALNKAVAVFNKGNLPGFPLITTDSGWSNGIEVLNKPESVDQTVDWWIRRQEEIIYNTIGEATLDPRSGIVSLKFTVMNLGIVNNNLEEVFSLNSRLLEQGKKYSGGVSLLKLLEFGVISSQGIRWQIIDFGQFHISNIPPVPTAEKLVGPGSGTVVDYGELSLTSENNLSILALLFGVRP